MILDLEDICFESVSVATAHCVIKLVRHSIYTENVTANSARDELMPEVLKRVFQREPIIDDKIKFYLFGQLRILSDILKALGRIRHAGVLPSDTDLEKKVSNLFEWHFLMAVD